jgi:hypothetical protein
MRAVLWKTTLNYKKQTQTVALRKIDLAQVRNTRALFQQPSGATPYRLTPVPAHGVEWICCESDR